MALAGRTRPFEAVSGLRKRTFQQLRRAVDTVVARGSAKPVALPISTAISLRTIENCSCRAFTCATRRVLQALCCDWKRSACTGQFPGEINSYHQRGMPQDDTDVKAPIHP